MSSGCAGMSLVWLTRSSRSPSICVSSAGYDTRLSHKCGGIASPVRGGRWRNDRSPTRGGPTSAGPFPANGRAGPSSLSVLVREDAMPVGEARSAAALASSARGRGRSRPRPAGRRPAPSPPRFRADDRPRPLVPTSHPPSPQRRLEPRDPSPDRRVTPTFAPMIEPLRARSPMKSGGTSLSGALPGATATPTAGRAGSFVATPPRR